MYCLPITGKQFVFVAVLAGLMPVSLQMPFGVVTLVGGLKRRNCVGVRSHLQKEPFGDVGYCLLNSTAYANALPMGPILCRCLKLASCEVVNPQLLILWSVRMLL